MKRVFATDALKCDCCGGRMRILCAVNPPDAIRKILDCLGMPIRAPPTAPALIEDWGGRKATPPSKTSSDHPPEPLPPAQIVYITAFIRP